jgi:hypothetical protein
MGLLSGVLPNHRDPFWDLEGRGVRRRRRLRRAQAFLAWLCLAAVVLLVVVGPAPFHLAFLPRLF